MCSKEEIENTFGNNPAYLLDVFGITASDLLRLEKAGYAVKARYETKQGHRIRWVIFANTIQGINTAPAAPNKK